MVPTACVCHILIVKSERAGLTFLKAVYMIPVHGCLKCFSPPTGAIFFQLFSDSVMVKFGGIHGIFQSGRFILELILGVTIAAGWIIAPHSITVCCGHRVSELLLSSESLKRFSSEICHTTT